MFMDQQSFSMSVRPPFRPPKHSSPNDILVAVCLDMLGTVRPTNVRPTRVYIIGTCYMSLLLDNVIRLV